MIEDVQTGAQILRRRAHELREENAIGYYAAAEIIEQLTDIQRTLEEAEERVETEPVDLGPEVEIPDGKVLKFIFETSHAPHYVMQLDNGLLVGLYAHVEFSADEEQTVFGLPKTKVKEKMKSEHVDVKLVDKDRSPFNEANDG